jgi:hypothetical protein
VFESTNVTFAAFDFLNNQTSKKIQGFLARRPREMPMESA